ncbi:MAG: 3'(2'),5'-bisphosphate nucleotidase CysQ [Desulfobacterales bacterium]|nr:3'(2'),5'-bisphosphate nucleotidase CysQ [Desulfobacterales bacterium]
MYEELLQIAVQAALEAGTAVLDVYRSDFAFEAKEDKSPLTEADLQSHRIIARHLAATSFPVLSEEGRNIPYSERHHWPRLWIVDPLDGTKEFIKRNGEFTVNIAMVDNGRPVLGVVLAPERQVLYLAARNMGAYTVAKEALSKLDKTATLESILKHAQRLPCFDGKGRSFTVIGSRSHGGPDLDAYVESMRERHGRVDFVSAGSSLKFCLVAEGRADVYPRLGPTMEWDTAAGQAVVEQSGGRVLVHKSGLPLTYNRENLLNPDFIVHAT